MAVVERDEQSELRDAIAALQAAENILASVDRSGILRQLNELIELISTLPTVQLDMRMARMRLTARLSSDPDKTPIANIKGQSQSMPRVELRIEPKPYKDGGKT